MSFDGRYRISGIPAMVVGTMVQSKSNSCSKDKPSGHHIRNTSSKTRSHHLSEDSYLYPIAKFRFKGDGSVASHIRYKASRESIWYPIGEVPFSRGIDRFTGCIQIRKCKMRCIRCKRVSKSTYITITAKNVYQPKPIAKSIKGRSDEIFHESSPFAFPKLDGFLIIPHGRRHEGVVL
ncbi:hypothetical protein AVEN_75366-1 [Araneus ventricosus]|uniref:Uncharacterized protein n=1 Tax=Araneus ventricosus TaxID=182803 RepID=A0A4Y2R3X9_ARAVE|nr:hypothetical protein AVEN_75366-1 [Araneus ventricosus]